MDCSLPGSSVYGISQARILGWVAISFSEGSSRPRDGAHISFIGRWGATRKAHIYMWEVLVDECIKNSHKDKKWPKQFLEIHCLMGFNHWKKNLAFLCNHISIYERNLEVFLNSHLRPERRVYFFFEISCYVYYFKIYFVYIQQMIEYLCWSLEGFQLSSITSITL